MDAVGKQYGSLVRIGDNYLITDNPDILFQIHGARSQYRRSDQYKAMRMDPTRSNVFSELDETRHMELRTKMAAGYSGKENLHLEESIDNRILDLVRLIEDKYLSYGSCMRPIDFARKAQYLTLDIITDIAFGEAFGDLVADKDVHEYLATIEQMAPVTHWLSVFPSLVSMVAIPWIGRKVLPSSGDSYGLGKVMGVAGAESTAIAIRSTLLHIITNPKVYAALQSEIDEAARTNSISEPIRDIEAHELPYLLACIKEGLRIWPPVPVYLTKTVPRDGDVLEGKYVPGGTNIGACMWSVQRLKSVFGEDAETFRPERWLEASEEQLLEMEKTNDLVFGYGRFQCLGKTVAMIELRKVFVELLRRFDFALIDPTQPWKCGHVGLWLQRDMFLRVSSRG